MMDIDDVEGGEPVHQKEVWPQTAPDPQSATAGVGDAGGLGAVPVGAG